MIVGKRKIMSGYNKIEEINLSSNCANLLSILQEKWDEIHKKSNVFRYKVHSLREKMLDGYLLQLNPDRCNKRRTPENIHSVCQPYDKDKFNFTKVSKEEIIINIREHDNDNKIHSVLVNVSPISQYHSLLCPSVNDCLPQIITEDSLRLAMKIIIFAEDRALRVGFNSLCALASVNHLHYHLFMEKHILPVENAECAHLCGPVYYLKQYPVPAFCFEVQKSESTAKVAKEIFKLLQYFLKKEIAHNLFMTKGLDLKLGVERVLRVLIWPRKSSAGVKQLGAFNVAVCELSGWFPVYSIDDFERLQPSDLEAELVKWKVDNFEELCNEIKDLFKY